MEIDAARLKTWGMALGCVVALLALVDSVALRGELVDTTSVRLSSGTAPGTIAVREPGREHTVVVTTRVRRSGETVGQAIAWRLVGPEGELLDEATELASRKRRFFSFVPTAAGEHALHIEKRALSGGSRGSAQVSVFVDDHRVLGPLLGF